MKSVGIILLSVLWAVVALAQTTVTPEWVQTYYSGAKQDLPNRMAMDANGNVFVAGHRVNADSMSTMDIQVVKFDATGNVVATAVINGSANDNDKVKQIVVDADGNVIITGTIENAETQKDLIVVKFDNDLNEVWRFVYDGAGSYDDRGKDVTVDAAGNIYVTGYSMEGSSAWVSPDAITLKLDASGNLVWKAIYDGPDGKHDEGRAIVVDGSGNVYVAGHSSNQQSQWAILLLKYDADGNLLWAVRHNGSAGNSFAISMALTANGVVLTGVASDNGGDVLTMAYDADGNQLWKDQFNSQGTSEDQPFDIAVDGEGNVIVGATVDGTIFDPTRDYAVLKYDASGNLVWMQRYDGPANDWDDLNAIDLDIKNNIYVTGQSNGVDTGPDFATLRYETDGTTMWEARYSSDGNKSDQAMDILIDGEGNVFVVGAANLDSTSGIALIKYDQMLVAPQLVSPADGAEQVTLTPALEWSAVNGAESYRVQLATDSNFTMLVMDTSVTAQMVQVDSLMYDTPYYWRVQAENYTGAGYWSETWMFRTMIAQPEPVTLLSPADKDTIETDSVQLVWATATPEVDQYQVQVAMVDDFSATVLDTVISDTTYQLMSLSDGETYFWRIRAHNISGWGDWSATWQFTVEIPLPLPAAVTLVAPANGATVTTDSVQLVWQSSQPEILHYLLEVSLSPDFDTLVVNDSSLTDTTFWFTGLSDSTTYYWRVKAHNASGWGEYSEVWEFTTQLSTPLELPETVMLKSPEDGATVEAESVELVWYAAQPEVDKYQVMVARDSGFTQLVVDTTVVDTTYQLTDLENNQTYYWKVRAHNASGWGEYSEAWSFTVAITGIETDEQLPVVFELKQNYPNPFNPATTIEYQLPVRSYVRLEIYNAVGEKIATLVNGEQSAQVHRVQWVANVPTGIYFYKLTAVDVNDPSHRFEQIRKMLLIK